MTLSNRPKSSDARVVELCAATVPKKPRYQFFKRLERRAKRTLYAIANAVSPPAASRAVPAAADVRKILFVRANFRIGNTVLATALLPLLRARFPQAEIDCLTTDATASLLAGLPFRQLHPVSRRFLYAPWRALALLRRLRAERYDLAVDGAMGSFSGAFYALLSGAKDRLGREGSRFLTVRLSLPHYTNVYERAFLVAEALEVKTSSLPLYHVSDAEDAEAQFVLREFGLWSGERPLPFVGVFVGGHLEKRWPVPHWFDLLDRLNEAAVPTVVFVGPEERSYLLELTNPRRRCVHVVPPGLRKTAALMSHATLLITPDSGPMHMAVALGVPLMVVVQTERSLRFVPAGAMNRMLFKPDPAKVHTAVMTPPAWVANPATADVPKDL